MLLVGGTPMRLKFTLDPLPCMLIPLRLCSLGVCSFMVLSFARVLFAHPVLRHIVSNTRKGYVVLATYGRVALVFRTNRVIECNVKCWCFNP